MTVDELIDLLAGLDGVYDAPPPHGDPVDLLAHGLQCAQLLRTRVPGDLGLQLAGLVHDIGHALGGTEAGHAKVGAAAAGEPLGARVARLVELHVPAKRYLAGTEDYPLSPASRASLAAQGAAMDAAERHAFRALPEAADAITLRRADEAAKVVGRAVPGLDAWVPRLRDHAAAR